MESGEGPPIYLGVPGSAIGLTDLPSFKMTGGEFCGDSESKPVSRGISYELVRNSETRCGTGLEAHGTLPSNILQKCVARMAFSRSWAIRLTEES